MKMRNIITTVIVCLCLCVTLAAKDKSKAKEAQNSNQEKKELTLEKLFPEKSFFGPSAGSTAFSFDGKYGAYLYRPYKERRHGSDLWIYDVSEGKTRRITSVSVMSPFQESARKVKEDRTRKTEKDKKKKTSDAKDKKVKDDSKEQTIKDKSTKEESRTRKEKKQKDKKQKRKKDRKESQGTKEKKGKKEQQEKEKNLGDVVSDSDAEDEKAPRYSGISSFAWSPKTNDLLFVSEGDIYLYKIKDAQLTRLTRTKERERSVAWLSDGSGYTFMRDKDLVKVRFGTHLIEQLYAKFPSGESMSRYRISPDGKRMVFLTEKDGPKPQGRDKKVSIANYRSRFMQAKEVSREVSDDPFQPREMTVYFYEINDPMLEDGELTEVFRHTLTTPRDYVKLPEWSPNSRRAVFSVYEQTTGQVKIMEASLPDLEADLPGKSGPKDKKTKKAKKAQKTDKTKKADKAEKTDNVKNEKKAKNVKENKKKKEKIENTKNEEKSDKNQENEVNVLKNEEKQEEKSVNQEEEKAKKKERKIRQEKKKIKADTKVDAKEDKDKAKPEAAREVYRFLHNGGPTTPNMIRPYYLADNRRIVFMSEQTGFRHLQILDPVYQSIEPLTQGHYEVYPLTITKKRDWMFVTATKEHPSRQDVYRISLKDGAMTRLTQGKGVYSSVAVSPDGTKVLANYVRYGKLRELVFTDVETGREKVLTDSHPAIAKELTKPRPKFFQYKNRNGQLIHGHMFKPENWSAKEKRPLLIYLYGGPLGTRKMVVEGSYQSSSYFFAHYMAQEHGYITCTIDPRGNSGYGALFEKSNYEQVGKPQVEDVVDGVNYLVDKHGVDPERVGIHGWSFGGFQTQMCLYTEPNVFAAGIAGAGPTEWENYNSWYTTGTIGASQPGKADLKKFSLLPLAKNLNTKLLLVHGVEDSNVLFQDTMRMYRELLKAGKETLVELFLDPTGGHGLGGDVKNLGRFRKYEEFLLRTIGRGVSSKKSKKD